ncbi:MAG: bifunctional riboflavin kinase/FAD synthetase [Bacteroidales bacterium]|nr:MAG: bifunctional riboflavin kinase/FAD synthetase [Bacteroidales bacterium]
MIIVQKPDQLEGKNTALTMGFFDGVHRGHRALTDLVLLRSKELNLASAVLTFWPHPRLTLNKDPHKLRFLTTLNEKSRIFSRLGFDFFIIQEFNLSFANLSAEDFLKLIVKSYNVRHIIIGREHRFGRKAEGDMNTIMNFASKYGYTYEEVGVIEQHDINISSTKIREALNKGDLEKANEMLGYPYLLTGTIEEGSKIGRKMGFPTANIRPIDPLKLIPADGVYAVMLNINGRIEKGMMNIGTRPTVDKIQQQVIEAHIFNFNEDIYNCRIDVALVERVRDEKRFQSIDHLKAQLEIDLINITNILSVYNSNNFENYFITLPRTTVL